MKRTDGMIEYNYVSYGGNSMHPFINIGNFQLPVYGLMLVLGISLGVAVAMIRAKKTAITPDDVLNSVTVIVFGALIGTKLLYNFTDWKYFIQNFKTIFTTWDGFRNFFGYGFVFYGALIGGVIAALIYIRRHKLPPFLLVDLLIASVPLMQGIGRIGCFFAGCCYGIEYSGPLAVTFPGEHVSRFPVQLLDTALNLVLFLILTLYRRKERKPGQVTGLYLLLYAFERAGVEMLRGDLERGFFLGLSTSQWISVLMIPVALLFLFGKFNSSARSLRARAKAKASFESGGESPADDASDEDKTADDGCSEPESSSEVSEDAPAIEPDAAETDEKFAVSENTGHTESGDNAVRNDDSDAAEDADSSAAENGNQDS